MTREFFTYEAYIDRYKTFWSEEGDGRPEIMSREGFQQSMHLLQDCYETYRNMIQLGQEQEASRYYLNIINPLENELAIADGTDNFL
ncbi:hypothetical protein GCM10011571_15440 [Marinithermofilum abyssi]|uniref:Uncharacterized protein n=1 Tax=Marinithermofilum abyssi TaxID=1571185 RepID=A0A8J2VF00_9BACL|nr:hypothetical protein [Marinithermofilum abyssi]GGE14835.1 hypothetical protein GCM10011571_15440 [Marinithermofilum abyssi]